MVAEAWNFAIAHLIPQSASFKEDADFLPTLLITIRVLNWNQLNVQKFTQGNKTTPDFRLQGKWVRIPSEPRVCKGFCPKTYHASHRGFLKSTTYTL